MSRKHLFFILFAVVAILCTAFMSAGPLPNTIGPAPTLVKAPVYDMPNVTNLPLKHEATSSLTSQFPLLLTSLHSREQW